MQKKTQKLIGEKKMKRRIRQAGPNTMRRKRNTNADKKQTIEYAKIIRNNPILQVHYVAALGILGPNPTKTRIRYAVRETKAFAKDNNIPWRI